MHNLDFLSYLTHHLHAQGRDSDARQAIAAVKKFPRDGAFPARQLKRPLNGRVEEFEDGKDDTIQPSL